jgi:hypothetical protein
LVDEATTLAVRAASGVTSSSLTNAQNAGNGLLGNGGAALGLGLGGGGNAKLSAERKHRMRDQATKLLSKAYHFDEIACSVATMQSASTLEDVAQLVLKRVPNDPEAKYVHFFHEKIPSRQLAECTSLQPLDEVILARPGEAEIWRTRAVTKIFKEDFVGAAHDLTEALNTCRYYQMRHKADRQQLQLASEAAAEAQRNSRWKEEIRLDEQDHPSSLETQLLFHRAGVYLTIACQYVNDALPPKAAQNGANGAKTETVNGNQESKPAEQVDPAVAEWERRKRLDARKIVKTNAKRALKDYVAYLAMFDYTPGLSTETQQEFMRKVSQATNGLNIPGIQKNGKSLDLESNASLSNGQLSDALVSHKRPNRGQQSSGPARTMDLPSLPPPVVYTMSALFSATPPSDLPPYPETATTLTTKQQILASQNEATTAFFARNHDHHEALTYHPLLTDALHSLLLCHCLVQTSKAELLRHAHMVARLARVCDGYPLFQAARSPSRADWIEVIRRSNNFVGLSQSWESLCAPAPLPGHTSPNQQKETPAEKRERLKQQAIMEALEDDRVHDEASFHAAVKARQKRQQQEEKEEESREAGQEVPKRWAQDDGKEYPISTERAAAIVRWVKEAPVGGETKKKKRTAKSGSKGKTNIDVDEVMADLKVGDNGEFEPVEEEVD